MDRVIEHLRALGFPEEGIDWLRRHRLSVIIALAALSWGIVGLIAWLLWMLARLVLSF